MTEEGYKGEKIEFIRKLDHPEFSAKYFWMMFDILEVMGVKFKYELHGGYVSGHIAITRKSIPGPSEAFIYVGFQNKESKNILESVRDTLLNSFPGSSVEVRRITKRAEDWAIFSGGHGRSICKEIREALDDALLSE